MDRCIDVYLPALLVRPLPLLVPHPLHVNNIYLKKIQQISNLKDTW